jgi:hypothetical protein
VYNVFDRVTAQHPVTAHFCNHVRRTHFWLPRQQFPTKTIPTSKMPKRVSKERETDLVEAMDEFKAGNFRSIRSAASAYMLPYTTLRDRLRGAQSRQRAHKNEQLLTVEEEKAIVRFCGKLDDLGHPLSLPMVKRLAAGMLPPSREREIGKHWINRFLKRNPDVVAKFSQRLDRQRATAGDPTVLKDFFIKVCSFHVSGYCDHEG